MYSYPFYHIVANSSLAHSQYLKISWFIIVRLGEQVSIVIHQQYYQFPTTAVFIF